ncbi:MAG TPA: hypothetical protein ENI70_01510, partial [Candidatus Peregrinibacteria bacterium]|nr:hypothetical protein [Candidatus Peregrinibacteria bacterium]
ENNNRLIFNFKKEEIVITTPATQIGEEEAKIKASVEGDENTIALNAEYLTDALNSFSTKEVAIGMVDKMTPALVRPSDKEDKYLHIIMPLKL